MQIINLKNVSYFCDILVFVATLGFSLIMSDAFYALSKSAHDLVVFDLVGFSTNNDYIYGSVAIYLFVFGVYHFLKQLVLVGVYKKDYLEAHAQLVTSINIKQRVYGDIRKSILYEVILLVIFVFSINSFLINNEANIDDPIVLTVMAAMCFAASGVVMAFIRYMPFFLRKVKR